MYPNLKTSFKLAIVFGLCAAGLPAQPSDDEASYRRASVGFRTGGNVFDLLTTQDRSRTPLLGPPPLIVTTSATSDSSRFFIGGAVQVNVTRKWSVEVDFLRRQVGYQVDSAVDTVGDVDDPSEFVRRDIDTVDAHYWDFPFLIKRYLAGVDAKARPYFSGGVNFRTITSVSGQRRTVLPEDLVAGDDGVIDAQGTTSSFAVETAKTTVPGGAVAIGVEVADDFGIKLNFEARYTRWLDKTTDVGFIRDNVSQLEVVVGVSF